MRAKTPDYVTGRRARAIDEAQGLLRVRCTKCRTRVLESELATWGPATGFRKKSHCKACEEVLLETRRNKHGT